MARSPGCPRCGTAHASPEQQLVSLAQAMVPHLAGSHGPRNSLSEGFRVVEHQCVAVPGTSTTSTVDNVLHVLQRPGVAGPQVGPGNPQAGQALPNSREPAAAQAPRGAVHGNGIGQAHGRPPLRANEITDLAPPGRDEVELRVGRDPAAAGRAHHRVDRIDHGIGQHQTGHQVRMPVGA